MQTPHSFTRRAKEQNLDIPTLIMEALEVSDYDIEKAAYKLNITRQGLDYQMGKHGIRINRCVVMQQKNAS